MISIQQAQKLTLSHASLPLEKVNIPLMDALNYHLGDTVFSPIHMPPFRQSAMDGYAVNPHPSIDYTLLAEIKAGDSLNPALKAGEAVRIFTGAPVPDDARAVIIQEKITKTDTGFRTNIPVEENMNIRMLGEQIKQGEKALEKGTLLTPSAIGFLASLGISSVNVYPKPRIGIVVTGNELISIGVPLKHGEIYESNSLMLQSVLNHNGFAQITHYKVDDDLEATQQALELASSENDLILISGGISVGNYDFVGSALENIGVEKIFHGVKQKPGKPLYFGKKTSQLFFALPGNPAAALSCFYIYILPVLRKITGCNDYQNHWQTSKSVNHFQKKGNRPQFLKALVKSNSIEILDGQASSMLHTFAVANALVFMDEDHYNINIGDTVSFLLI